MLCSFFRLSADELKDYSMITMKGKSIKSLILLAGCIALLVFLKCYFKKPILLKTKTPAQNKKYGYNNSLLLFVGIYSAPQHLDRRNAVRETWLTICKNTPYVLCRFVTDGQDVKGNALQGEVKEKLENESRIHDDMLLAQSPGGVNFARRYLWLAEWASERYNFQYLLRVDDDYFICFERLLMELRYHRPRQKLAWGWLHCSIRGKYAFFLVISGLGKDLGPIAK